MPQSQVQQQQYTPLDDSSNPTQQQHVSTSATPPTTGSTTASSSQQSIIDDTSITQSPTAVANSQQQQQQQQIMSSRSGSLSSTGSGCNQATVVSGVNMFDDAMNTGVNDMQQHNLNSPTYQQQGVSLIGGTSNASNGSLINRNHKNSIPNIILTFPGGMSYFICFFLLLKAVNTFISISFKKKETN